MQRIDYQSVGDVLRAALNESRMGSVLDSYKAIGAWEVVVGPYIAGRTMRPTVTGSTMWVRTPHAALRHELQMKRTALLRSINDMVGRQVITDIRFTQ